MHTERKSVAVALPSGAPETGAAEMSRILNQIGLELRHLVEVMEPVEDAVGRLASSATVHDRIAIEELQNLDRVCQTMAGLASFLGALALTVPRNWHVDARGASQNVRLSALARRLGAASDAFHPEEQGHHGDCEIF